MSAFTPLTSRQMLATIASSLALPPSALDQLSFSGAGDLSSCYAVTDLAAASVGAAALAVRQLMFERGGDQAALRIDRRLASLWFGFSLHPLGWEMPPAWDAVAGDYACADGWIRLHTNAARHRSAALAVLGCAADRAAVAQQVAGWSGAALETAIVEQGGCAAQMRSGADWLAHPQGSAVASEALIAFSSRPAAAPASWRPGAARPLAGLKVLDLTRILAGPVATRFLAGYGAEVLRIDPPGWEEAGVIPEVALGKRCARLDLEAAPDRAVFEGLLAQADVLVHGYRPAALEQLGYGEAVRRQLNPDLVDVSLNAYGWSGPWRERRGFDSLVQMSSGIAELGMHWKNAGRPFPLPVQALDHATGYLMAAAAVRGVQLRLTENRVAQARLSLARTARLLVDTMPYSNSDGVSAILSPANEADLAPELEQTGWGPARRYLAPVEISGAPMAWDHPARALGWSAASW